MLVALNIARNSCRNILQRSLQSRTSSNSLQSSLLQRELLRKQSPVIYFSTTLTARSAEAHDHSHSRLWTIERFLSAGLLAILPIGIAFPNPVLDYAIALSLTAHCHWGIEAVVVDYVRPAVVGVAASKAALAAIYALSAFTLGGLFYFNYNDVGLCQAIRMLWKL